jgi:two-component system NtrC family sensor kinase
MRLSVATKIFLGFAIVIVAFGSACVYTIYRMNDLRESMAVVWQDVSPIAGKLRSVSRRLRAPEEFLVLRKASDSEWLQRLLPTVKPFEKLKDIEGQLRAIISSGKLADTDKLSISKVVDNINEFRQTTTLFQVVKPHNLKGMTSQRNETLFRELIERTVSRARAGQLTSVSPETRATIRCLRKINRFVIESLRALAEPVRTLNERATADEKAATLAVILIASGALVLSLLMLIMSQLTLGPIRRLSEGARRIAEGKYDKEVVVRSRDEIGQLAEEFNRMAMALRERDEALDRQKEELLRKDRLATIGKLAAQITHEVRNPLTSIGLNAELIEEEWLNRDEDARPMLKAIQAEVQRLKTITEGYLQYARLPQPDRAVFSLTQMVASMMAFLDTELVEAGIQWQVNGANQEILVLADEAQIRTGVLNVARNAMEAIVGSNRPGNLRMGLQLIGKTSVQIAITDSGDGVDSSLTDRIFEPFVSGKSTGTGLGLALTREIIVAHGGSIQMKSPVYTEGGASYGTMFILELPCPDNNAVVVDPGQSGYSE